ncbi:MAG: ribosome maturation factor RimP [Candidatus Krumholzibacteriota bacterium]|nr:ribosome maturation factor RimP [Candidatus Krumholzibacteriota bacterium]
MSVNEQVASLVNKELEALGVELVKLDLSSRGKRSILRVFIDDPEKGVTIDDCVRVTKALGLALDGEDIIQGRYNLEISTPGMNRPLTRRDHYLRFTGKTARVEYMAGGGEKRSSIGEITGIEEDKVILTDKKGECRIEFGSIIKANLYGEKWGTGDREKNIKSRKAPKNKGKHFDSRESLE